MHTPAGAELKRRRAPGIAAGTVALSLPLGGSYRAASLEPVPTLTLPADLAERIGVADDDVVELLDAVDGDGPLHRAGGWSRDLTGPVDAQAARESARSNTGSGRRLARDFAFVLQLDTDEDSGLCVEGDGIAYVLSDQRTKPARLVVVTQAD